jgi:hypothetical protein
MEDCSYSPTQLLFQYVPGVGGTGCEADLLPQSSAQVRNAWSCISSTLVVFVAWRFIIHRGDSTFTLNAVSSRRKNVLFEAFYEIQKSKLSLRRSFAGCSYIEFPSGSNRPYRFRC